jgi:hypothetical protein
LTRRWNSFYSTGIFAQINVLLHRRESHGVIRAVALVHKFHAHGKQRYRFSRRRTRKIQCGRCQFESSEIIAPGFEMEYNNDTFAV